MSLAASGNRGSSCSTSLEATKKVASQSATDFIVSRCTLQATGLLIGLCAFTIVRRKLQQMETNRLRYSDMQNNMLGNTSKNAATHAIPNMDFRG